MDVPESQILEFDDFRIDLRRRLLLSPSGEAIPLTPKVFDTLVYLVTNAGRLIGKNELISFVWSDAIVEENNLNQNIAALRRIFGESPGEQRFIVTVSGHGYRFVPAVRRCQPDSSNDQVNSPETIAILPFKSIVADDRDEVLEMGMADTLISRLGGNSLNVVVRPLASVYQYSRFDKGPLEAGRELNVRSVVDGRIQRVGDKIRVNVNLLRTEDGVSIWAGTFDEDFSDILTVQDLISKRIAAALQTKLGDGRQRSTENVEAYQLYSAGRYHIGKMTPEGLRNGIASFQRAIELDPRYALAHAGLADAYHRISIAGELPAKDFFPKSIASAQSAIEIAPQLCEAYVILGWATFWHSWNWELSESYLRKALKLDRNSPDAHEAYAHLYSNTGRHVEALAMIGRARELNPLSLFVHAMEGQFLMHAGRIEDAIEKLGRALELEPRFWLTHLFLATAYFELSRYEEAEEEASAARELSGGSTHAMALSMFALVRSGRVSEAEALMEELIQITNKRFVPPYHLALAQFGVGSRELALDNLETAYKLKDPKMVFLTVEPKWRDLRSEGRFQKLIERLKLK